MAKTAPMHVCLNITADLGHLELLGYDIIKGDFVHLDSENMMYDPATRDFLEEPERFKTTVKRLFDRNKIPMKTPTVLVLPSFFTREYAVPEYVEEDELKSILMSEAERFYVFKKIDPDVGYCPMADNQVLYSAYPMPPLEYMKGAFKELKIPLIGVDINYTAALRGLVGMGVVQVEMTSQLKWGMMLISDYMLFMAIVEGGQFVKVQESPLPMENAEESIFMAEIKNDFQQFFGFEVLSRMVLINNSTKIYSTTLVEHLGFQGATNLFDQNERTLSSLNEMSDAPFPCTLEAVGGALVRTIEEVPGIELYDGDDYHAMQMEEVKSRVAYGLIGAGVVVFIVQFAIGALLDNLNKGEVTASDKIQSEISTTLSNLSLIPEVKQKIYMKTGMFQNYKMSNLLFKIESTLPADAWLNQVTLKGSQDLKSVNLSVTGSTKTSDPLNAYVQELNNEIGTPAITPKILPQQKEDQRYFDYTLSNTPEGTPNAQ